MQEVRQALVLGGQASAQIIGKQLEEAGWEVLFPTALGYSGLPCIADPNSFSEVRSILQAFAELSQSQAQRQGVVHPGTTVWADRPELASIAEEFGLTVICPSTRILSLFSNQLNLLMSVEQCGIPHLVQSLDPIHTVRELEEFIRNTQQSFPLILKSVKGGGSFGIFVVSDEMSLKKRLPLWLDQLRRKQGEVILFVEKYLEGARHVVFPFARYQDGYFQEFPTLDSSLQSQQRKLIGLSPCNQISDAVFAQLQRWTKRLADHWGYVGVGAFEFLVDGSRAYFIQGMARLNTDFHLWEAVSETQAVHWQIDTLENYSAKNPPRIKCQNEWHHGLSLRVYAEDSCLQLPQPGEITELFEKRSWDYPTARAEWSLNYEKGQTVSVFDSGLLGILWLDAKNRKQLFTLAQGILKEFWIAGSIQTNERFLIELLSHPWVKEEIFHAGFVDEEFLPNIRPPAEVFLISVAGLVSHPDLQARKNEADLWLVGDQYLREENIPMKLEWVDPPQFSIHLGRETVSGQIRMQEGEIFRILAFPILSSQSAKWLIRLGSWFLTVRQIKSDRKATKRTLLSALVTGRVHAILYRPGVRILSHEPLVILESLGQLIPHSLPLDSRVKVWNIQAEDRVVAGQELAEIEVYKVTEKR